MNGIALLPDVVLPVLHKVLQRDQRVFHDWHHVFRGPGLHGDQHDPRVQLFLVDLGPRRGRREGRKEGVEEDERRGRETTFHY